MATTNKNDECLSVFVEKAKAENQKYLEENLDLQRILEELDMEVEHPQIYQMKVSSNW